MKCVVTKAAEVPSEGAGGACGQGAVIVDGNCGGEVGEAERAPLWLRGLSNDG